MALNSMKERISVTIDREINELLDRLSKKRKFRNRSHIVEFAVERLAKEELGEDIAVDDKAAGGLKHD